MRNARHPCPVSHCHNARQRWAAVCRRCFDRLPVDYRAAFKRARDARDVNAKHAAGVAARDWLNAHAPDVAAARMIGDLREMMDG